MGKGFELRCSNCGHSEEVLTGAGMSFPRVYEETLESARRGAFGPEWEKALNENPRLEVNAETELYQCPKCNALKTEPNLAICEPSDPAADSQALFCPWCSGDGQYRFIRSYVHRCGRCGARTRKVSEDEISLVADVLGDAARKYPGFGCGKLQGLLEGRYGVERGRATFEGLMGDSGLLVKVAEA